MHAQHTIPDGDRGCGRRLRSAREAAGLEQQEVSKRLKMPLRVVQALENEDWDCLGAPVFVRGQLRSYSRLLGLSTEPVIQAAGIEPVLPPELVSHVHVPAWQRHAELFGRRMVYVVMTVAIAVPVWLATQSHPDSASPSTASLDLPAGTAANADAGVQPASERSPARRGAKAGAAGRDATPLVASLASLPPRPASSPALALHFNAASWLEVDAPDGRVIERGLLAAGQQRSYALGQVGRIVLGNATAVEVERSGDTVDLAPYQRANVARFTVSSDGSLAPVSD